MIETHFANIEKNTKGYYEFKPGKSNVALLSTSIHSIYNMISYATDLIAFYKNIPTR